MRFLLKTLFLVNFLIFLSGCVPVMVGSGMVAGGYTAIRDKKLGDSFSDTKLETLIKSKLYKISPELYSAVSVTVDQKCALLTGAVQNSEWIAMAEKEAWSVDDIDVVDNNIVFGEIPVSQIMSDSLITSSCRTSLVCSKDIKSVNYKLKTVNGVVYVTGMARSNEELTKVLETLQRIRNVKKIVSYVNVMK